MNRNPIYDEDYVTLGYLKDYVASDTEGGSELEYSKNYGSQPTPPYHVNDTWTDASGVYVCINERLIGEFDISDWKLIVDTGKYDDYIANTLEVTVDMLAVQQDNKIESFIQSVDPSLEWDTSVIKEKHVFDFWRPSENSIANEKMYKKFPTNPVSYEWVDAIVPLDVWDATDGHKNLWGVKPTEYEARDLWHIEDGVDVNDLPVGCVAGDWAIATVGNTEYDKTNWVNTEFYIDLETVQEHFYTKSEVDKQNEVLTDTIESSISASESEIIAKVESTYETKETVESVLNDVTDLYNTIGTVNETIINQTNIISALETNVGAIGANISTINNTIGYVQTTDVTYLDNKIYYRYDNGAKLYYELIKGTDYTVGGTILPSIVYENKYERDIKSLDTRLSSTDAKLSIVGTHIDNETGDIREITTDTGFTFNSDGLHIEKSGAATKSTVDEAGVEVQATGNNEVQFYAGYVNEDIIQDESSLSSYRGQTVTYTNNVVFKKYLATGNGRMENVSNDKYGKGIGFFV